MKWKEADRRVAPGRFGPENFLTTQSSYLHPPIRRGRKILRVGIFCRLGGRRVGREKAQAAQNRRAEDGVLSQRPRSADTEEAGGRTTEDGRRAASEKLKAEKLKLGNERQTADRPGGPAAPRAACSVNSVWLSVNSVKWSVFYSRKVGREKAQKAQETESECVTEITERGHRGSRRRAEE